MSKLDLTRERIATVLASSQNIAIALSFGLDSVLLAALVLQQKPETTCIWLHQFQTKQQRAFPEKLIVDWDLTVWSCGVNEWAIINHDGLPYVALTYALNGDTFTTVHDVIHKDDAPCLLRLRPSFSDPITLPLDTIFTGWRKSDAHPLMPVNYRPDKLGNISLVTPLEDWTEEEVRAATRELSLPINEAKYAGDAFADPDNVIANITCWQKGNCSCLI